MATIVRNRRLTNPGRKKKMTPAQIRFFGTKRQRAALKNRGKRRNISERKTIKRVKMGRKKSGLKPWNFPARSYTRKKSRKRNVSSILTVWPKSNPGRKRRKSNRGKRVVIINKGVAKMATRRRRRVTAKRVVRRRRQNYGTKVGRSWSSYSARRTKKRNPGRRRARRNPGVRRHHRRRNPGMLTGTAGRVLGVIGGLAVTKLLTGFLPASINTGVIGYLSTGVLAVLQGKAVAKFAKSEALGNDMMVGGLAYLAAKVLNDFFPSIGTYTGISGMGLIGGSSFYVPQVNQNGSMGSFVVPGAVTGAIPMAMPKAAGMGSMRRTGRLM